GSACAIQRAGRIVVAGAVGPGGIWGQEHLGLFRYLSDGRLDPAFGGGGKVRGPAGEADAVAIQADGKIIAAGTDNRGGITLVRYTPDGRLDHGFGAAGRVVTEVGPDGHANAVAIQRDGKMVVAGGTAWHGGEDSSGGAFALVRYAPDGRLDASFGDGGKALVHVGAGRQGEAFAVAIQTDGRIVVAGGLRDAADLYGAPEIQSGGWRA